MKTLLGSEWSGFGPMPEIHPFTSSYRLFDPNGQDFIQRMSVSGELRLANHAVRPILGKSPYISPSVYWPYMVRTLPQCTPISRYAVKPWITCSNKIGASYIRKEREKPIQSPLTTSRVPLGTIL